MKPQSLFFAVLLNLSLNAAYAESPHSHPAPSPAHDNRVVLELAPGERAMILEEMRLFLSGLQKMTGALGKQDMPAAAAAARGMGRIMTHEVPPTLRAKLPQEFRQLGFSVHSDFDQIALDAKSLKDVSYSLGQVSATLQKCVNCHTTYQIRSPALNAGHWANGCRDVVALLSAAPRFKESGTGGIP